MDSLYNDVYSLSNNTFQSLRNGFNEYVNYMNANGISDGLQNNNMNYDEILEEKKLTQKSIDKYIDEKCVICLENFMIGNKICYLPCLHLYHTMCIKNWLKIKEKCPLCNNDINNNNLK